MESTENLHPSAARVARALRERGVEGPVRQFSASTKTSAEAATALGCALGAIASCLVFVLDDEPVVILKSGAFRVDTAAFAELVGGTSLRRASAEEVRASTGQPIGGVSPVGWPGRLRVFIDDSLGEFREIWSACGTPNAVFATTYDELRELTGATPVTLTRS
ncbi:MAG TPA: YbaK/EbsC family protein [Acidimicrobiales bacterium]|nr:YbaK/EbsC family protein [Acidimicrobiales bacterium]